MSDAHSDSSVEAHPVHDQAAEVAHAWKDLRRDIKIFACFFGIILLTVLSFNINFGPTGNLIAALFFAAARAAMIAYFFLCLIGTFSFVVRTIIFTAVFFAGMVFLSMWDSFLPHIGNPIKLPDTHVSRTP
jgi:hypothetical protein